MARYTKLVALAMQMRTTRSDATLRALSRLCPSHVGQLRNIIAAEDAYVKAFHARWMGQVIKATGNSYARTLTAADMPRAAFDVNAQGVSATAATDRLRARTATLTSAYMPIRKVGRHKTYTSERDFCSQLTGSGQQAKLHLLQDIASEIIRAGASPRQLVPDERSRIEVANRKLQLGSGISDAVDREIVHVPPSRGPLRLQCGWMVDLGPVIAVATPGSSGGSSQWRPVPVAGTPLRIPALVDLDQGGLATDSRDAVTSIVLRLLALLPPGHLKLDVFDPAGMGRSVSYLATHGQATTAILGDGVRTSARDLRELLDRVEAHIAMVTTKYLGSQHRTLHDYNRSAGDVAEPYHLLVLFDYPDGFQRADGSTDHDLLAQLGKLIKAGPRCGVYTVAHVNHAAHPGPNTSSIPVVPPGLPFLSSLHTDDPTRPQWPSLMLAPAPAPKAGPTQLDISALAQVVANGDPSAMLSVAHHLFWYPPQANDIDPVAVSLLMDRLEKGIQDASKVEVSSVSVAALSAKRRRTRVTKGLESGPSVALPADPATWWKGDSTESLTARVGRTGSDEVAQITIGSSNEDFGMLIGGKPGSGKSVFLHALVGDLTRTYSPEQLQLFLLDIKHGVSFRPYAVGRSPHSRVVGLECDRAFGVAVLRSLTERIARRSKQFKAEGVSTLAGYRRKTRKAMPRILAVIDEFHGLFEVDDRLGEEAAGLLQRIIKQGRSFGVHVVLATQQLSGAPALPKDALRMLPVRVVFQCTDADSRLLLGDDNPAGAALLRAGQGLINRRNGAKDANEPFQGVFVDEPAEVEQQLTVLRRMAKQQGITQRPVVFDATEEPRMDGRARTLLLAAGAKSPLRIPIGVPVGLGPPVCATIGRGPAGNLLVVAPPARGIPALVFAALTCTSSRVEVQVADFAGMNSPFSQAFEPFEVAAVAHALPLRVLRARDINKQVAALRAMVEERHRLGEFRAGTRLLILAGLQTAQQLDQVSAISQDIEHILAEGATVGIHLVVWVESAALVHKRFGYSALEQFSARITARLSQTDSSMLLDEPIAAQLNDLGLAVLDRNAATLETALAYAIAPVRAMSPR